jgi:hypothetical protein
MKAGANAFSRSVPRCGARNRAGKVCACPAMRGRQRCRLHGGLSPGAPTGPLNGNYTQGNWTKAAEKERQWLRALTGEFAKDGQL